MTDFPPVPFGDDRGASRAAPPAQPATATATDMRVALCPHLSLEHYRGGEKWTAALANRLVADGVNVAVHALPYAPGNTRRVAVRDVLDAAVPYREAWRHDLSAYDTAYVFYAPLSELFFTGASRTIAGIHSWVYVSPRLFESHYGPVPTVVKALYRTIGATDIRRYTAVHTVTPAFRSPHPNTVYIPNFVDTDRFYPGRVPLDDEFTVLVTAARIREKGWDTVRAVARRLPPNVRLLATGTGSDPHVTDLGFLTEDELADAYARAHVVLHAARVDTDSMVINEACASGTPVVTTSLPTHDVENEAVLHRDTPDEILGAIAMLYDEWERGDGYDERCRVSRREGETHGFDVVYPQLKRLLLGQTVPASRPEVVG
ncbi:MULTISPECIES: glycosyltransferase family 4 protein [Haloferax]|uniref:Glycosyl transferases group 1 n=1 Tax=Haloferax massiliensis TaxID=1476858 RepID=A0A0D6JUJ2_9EURY|nr:MULTISPECIES: glycosyltransferase [Haloferax]MDS0241733.1 glycosyltransferase [Haloferax sp. S2CR25]MDS0444854.1 glycosyltransferase [Haloferax sp. S2CR25-2]CQR52182.1 hypothetical protein BN996_03022 [Haloferax massiliensis]